MLSRRSLVGRIAAGMAGAAVVLKGGRAGAAVSAPRTSPVDTIAAQGPVPSGVAAESPPTPAGLVPWHVLAPLSAGSSLYGGWTLAACSPVFDGAAVLTLRNAEGRERRVHLCRRGSEPAGIAQSRRFDLVLMNGGAGDVGTDESLAQAIAQIAQRIESNDAKPASRELEEKLLSHTERQRQFADSVHARLR